MLREVRLIRRVTKNIAHINIGSGKEVSIKKLSEIIKNIVRYKGRSVFNRDYPDGMPRKLLNIDRIIELGWKSSISLEQGIRETYKWFKKCN